MTARRKVTPLAIAIAIIVVVGIVAAVVVTTAVHNNNLKENGETAVGTAISFERIRHTSRYGGGRTDFKVSYLYIVDGTRYSGTGSESYDTSDEVMERVKEEKTVTVYYDPENPTDNYINDYEH